MWNDKKTQDILHTYFTRQVEDLTPVNYNLFIQSPDSFFLFSEEKVDYPSLPQGTVIVASSAGDDGSQGYVVRTPDNTYQIVVVQEQDQYKEVIVLSETPEVDPKTPVGELYDIQHSYIGSHYQYTSYTSKTGYFIHLIVDDVDPHLGGFSTFTKDFIKGSKYIKYID